MTEDSSDSIVGMLKGSPVVVCFESAPMKILSVITKRQDGRWTTALPGEGTIEFLNRDIPNCSRWCFAFIVARLRALGWSVDNYANYVHRTSRTIQDDIEGALWDDVTGLAGSIG